jgi:hypothetical protein
MIDDLWNMIQHKIIILHKQNIQRNQISRIYWNVTNGNYYITERKKNPCEWNNIILASRSYISVKMTFWGKGYFMTISVARLHNFFNRYSGGWSPIESPRHCGHQQAFCASPGWLWWWRNWWNDDWQGKPRYSEKTCPSAALSTTNPTCSARTRTRAAAVGSKWLTAYPSQTT